ncbi:hypothetical protein D3C81_1937240 [compost metagenome]
MLAGAAIGDSEPNTSKLVSAAGPTASKADEPHRMPITLGNKAAYKPVAAGIPASVAYATACGINTRPTLIPAQASLLSEATVGRGQFRKGKKRLMSKLMMKNYVLKDGAHQINMCQTRLAVMQ